MKVIKIGCDLSNQCYNYKISCEYCNQNWEMPYEERKGYDDYSDNEYDEDDCDCDCETCEFKTDCVR